MEDELSYRWFFLSANMRSIDRIITMNNDETV
jgi:hypothetical protein